MLSDEELLMGGILSGMRYHRKRVLTNEQLHNDQGKCNITTKTTCAVLRTAPLVYMPVVFSSSSSLTLRQGLRFLVRRSLCAADPQLAIDLFTGVSICQVAVLSSYCVVQSCRRCATRTRLRLKCVVLCASGAGVRVCWFFSNEAVVTKQLLLTPLRLL